MAKKFKHKSNMSSQLVIFMELKTFKQYLEENSRGYRIFTSKALDYQIAKNKWNDAKIERTVQEMWKQVSENAYEKIKAQKGKAYPGSDKIWIDFMNEIEFIDMFDESMAELEFE